MKKTFLQELGEVISDLTISLVMTIFPCAIFGVLGTLLAMWLENPGDFDFSAKLISWGIFTVPLFIYALVDRIALRIYSRLGNYTHDTGRRHLNLWGVIDIFFYGWCSTDKRPRTRPRPRAFYYNS